MQGDHDHEEDCPGTVRPQAHEPICNERILAGSEAVAAEGAGESRLPVLEIAFPQGVVAADAGAFAAAVAPRADVEPEGRDLTEQVGQGTHGAEGQAVDHDPQAITATHRNAEQNQVSQQVTTTPAETLPMAEADLILANILAQPLIELAPLFYKLLKPGGTVVISGLLADQTEEISEVYRAHFQLEETHCRDDWVCISASKPAAAA